MGDEVGALGFSLLPAHPLGQDSRCRRYRTIQGDLFGDQGHALAGIDPPKHDHGFPGMTQALPFFILYTSHFWPAMVSEPAFSPNRVTNASASLPPPSSVASLTFSRKRALAAAPSAAYSRAKCGRRVALAG